MTFVLITRRLSVAIAFGRRKKADHLDFRTLSLEKQEDAKY